MDMNEILNQLASDPQMVNQLVQLMQQNGMIPNSNMGNSRPMMNWNIPTNPMAALWWYNMMNSMNNMNGQNKSQPIQNQNEQQPLTPQNQQTNNVVSSIRVVKSSDDIKPNEIPANGDISLFLQDDLSVIYGKRWVNDGSVDNMRFVLEKTNDQNVKETSTEEPNSSKLNLDMEQLATNLSNILDERLNQFVKEYSLDKRSQMKTGNSKKGVEENGD